MIDAIISGLTSSLIYPSIVPGIVIGLFMIIFGALAPRFAGSKLPLTIGGLVIILFFVFFAGKATESTKWKAEVDRQQLEIATLNSASKDVSAEIVVKYVDRIKIVEKVRKELVNVYVDKIITEKIDSSTGNMPNAFVRLHDDAVKGVIPDSTRDSDASSSGFKLSTATKVIVDNYQICRVNSEQLISLQDWIRGQQLIYK